MIGHNITCSWTSQKLSETVHGTRLPCLVPPGRLCRTRGTILETSGTNQGNNRRTRLFCHHWAYTEGEPNWRAHDTHNPRFSRPALRKQFSTHDAVDIIIMFRFKLFLLFRPLPFVSLTPRLTFFLFFPNLSSFDGFLLFRDPFFILL